ncbi:LysM peptidoglycan-binding domain-containing protein [Pararhodobacter marinus]|uniref:LysM peptidoglycan-binding domain-containing protein n=1 Tax=Pararhodobacter marinus TaxID=2184063 RepID=UPI0035129E7B
MIKGLVWWLGGGAIVAAGVVAWVILSGRPAELDVPVPANDSAATGEVAPPADTAASAPEPRADVAEDGTESADQGAPVTDAGMAEAPVVPAFDVVRVARDGAALVAGSASPGAAINLRVDGAVVAQAMADSAGQFVAIFSLGSSDAAQMMTLEMEDGAGNVTQAVDTVILTPRPQAPEQLAALAPEGDASGAETAGQAVAETGDTPGDAGQSDDQGAGQAAVEGLSDAPVAEMAPAGDTAADTGREAATTDDGAGDEALARDIVTGEPSSEETAPRPAETAETAPDGAAPEQAGAGDAPEIASPREDSAPEAPRDAEIVAEAPSSDAQTETPDTSPAGGAPDTSVVEQAETALAQAQAAAPGDTAELPTAFLLRGDGQVEVLDPGPNVMDNVVIDTISYSDSGDVQISGRAAGVDPRADLRIYLDNRAIATATAEAGDWRLDLPAIAPGVYTLRVDQLSDGGGVTSRFETPFQREDPARVAEAQAQIDAQNAALAQAEAQAPGGDVPSASPVPDIAQAEGGDAPASTTEPATTSGERPAPDAEEPAQIASLDAAGPGAQRNGQADGESRPAPQGDSRVSAPGATDAQASASAVPPPSADPTQMRTETAEARAVSSADAGRAADGEAPANGTRPASVEGDASDTASSPAPSPMPAPPTPSVSLITVQPGHTLWHISRERYGQGEQYVIIYRANRSQIRDPDLIYPGQIFTLPDR